MVSLQNIYRYNAQSFTGTDFQPDTLSTFLKKDKNKGITYIEHVEPPINVYAKTVPIVGSFYGILRIVAAVKEIFQNCAKAPGTTDYWNAFKNLFRGIVEMIPFTGVFLMIYDAIRKEFIVKAKMTDEIKNEENIVGVARDGIVLFKITLADYDKFLIKYQKFTPQSSQDTFFKFDTNVLKFLEIQNQKNATDKMSKVFKKLTLGVILLSSP